MLLIPYNVKSAELHAPKDQTKYYRDLVGYTEYKDLYDAFIEDSAMFAANPDLWWRSNDPSLTVHKQHVEQLIDRLSACAYVQFKLPSMISVKQTHIALTYGRILTSMLFVQ